MSIGSIKPWQRFLDAANSEAVRRSDKAPPIGGGGPFSGPVFSRRNFVRAAAGLAGVVLASRLIPPAAMPGVSWAANGTTAGVPPFDFADGFYLENGINPGNILSRVDGTCPAGDKPACSVVDNSNTDPDRRNIRVLSTTGGFDHEGNPLYYNIFGMVMPDTFTDDTVGQEATDIANDFEAYIFPKANGEPLSPDLSNRRQDNVFDTRNGYFVANPLGLWTAVFVRYTPAAFNTARGQATLTALAAQNGTDLDGTPMIRKAVEVDILEKKGLAEETTRPLDGSQGFPWII